MLGWCNFNDIDVITDIGTIGNISFGNFAITQIIMNKDLYFYLIKIVSKKTLTKIIMSIFINKNNVYIFFKVTLTKFLMQICTNSFMSHIKHMA